MATLTITIRNTLKVYGVEPHNKWGELIWGTDTWAETDVEKDIYKFLPISLSVDTVQNKRVKLSVLDTMSLSSSVSKAPHKNISDSISLDSARMVKIRKKISEAVTLTDVYYKRPIKSISDSVSIATSYLKNVKHLVSEPLTVATVISRRFPFRIAESLNVSSAVTVIYRKNNGWYLKKGDTINALNYPQDQFSEVANINSTWTEISVPTTTWTTL